MVENKSKSKGFTLVELVIVIVIIGLLAAFALPRFIDVSAEAAQSSVDGIASGITGAMASNYGVRKANSSNGSAVDNCSDGASLLPGGLPAGYSITAAAVSADEEVVCTLTGEESKTATFIAIGVS